MIYKSKWKGTWANKGNFFGDMGVGLAKYGELEAKLEVIGILMENIEMVKWTFIWAQDGSVLNGSPKGLNLFSCTPLTQLGYINGTWGHTYELKLG